MVDVIPAKDKKTIECLLKAFAGESQARNKYNFFASVARKEGYEQIASIFEETADNEKEHAKMIYKFLKGIKTTPENLVEAIKGEHYEWSEMYPEFEKIAREAGDKDAAKFFKEVAEVEQQHEKRFRKLLENIKKGEVFEKRKPIEWKCRNCGYIYYGKKAPKICPACRHPRAFYEVRCKNY
ncbi:MAG: ferritin family protein [Candidatus Micrarchaeia archaeon]